MAVTKLIKADTAAKLVSKVGKDDTITRTELRQLDRLGTKRDDAFVKENGKVPSAVADVRDTADRARYLLDAKLKVTSTVDGIKVSFAPSVNVERDDYGDVYHRFLTVQLDAKTVSKNGALAFQYGDFKVKIPVKAGEKASTVLSAIERRILQQQNGAMSVSEPDSNATKPSLSMGIHQVAPLTQLERLQMQLNLMQGDLWEMQSEGAPQSMIDPVIADMTKLQAKIDKLNGAA